MTKLKWCTMRVSLGRYIVGVAAATSLLTLSPIARAQEGDSEVDELRKQVRQLEAQVQALRAAINDSIDVNRQQIASLNRALKGQGPAPSESAPRPRAESAPDNVRPPPSLPKLAPGKGGAVATRGGGRRRAANDEAATGAIRGRVEVPSGEPVAYVYVENIFEPAVQATKR